MEKKEMNKDDMNTLLVGMGFSAGAGLIGGAVATWICLNMTQPFQYTLKEIVSYGLITGALLSLGSFYMMFKIFKMNETDKIKKWFEKGRVKRFHYGDKVKVINGFYKGETGTVFEERKHHWYWDEKVYTVYFDSGIDEANIMSTDLKSIKLEI